MGDYHLAYLHEVLEIWEAKKWSLWPKWPYFRVDNTILITFWAGGETLQSPKKTGLFLVWCPSTSLDNVFPIRTSSKSYDPPNKMMHSPRGGWASPKRYDADGPKNLWCLPYDLQVWFDCYMCLDLWYDLWRCVECIINGEWGFASSLFGQSVFFGQPFKHPLVCVVTFWPLVSRQRWQK